MEKKRGKRSKPMEDGMWDCSVCTFKNSAEAFKCAMCDVRKGTSTRKPKPNPQLVAQQVAQQMVTAQKKQSLKRAAERVDLGSDTSQDSHRSETRDGEPSFSKTSSSVLSTNGHLSRQQTSPIASPVLPSVPSTSQCGASGPPSNQVQANVSRHGPEAMSACHLINFSAHSGNQRQSQIYQPHNKSFSSVRQSHITSPNGNSFAYPFFMDITVNGLTVRIEERDPKSANCRQTNAQRMKRRKTPSNQSMTLGSSNENTSPVATTRTSTSDIQNADRSSEHHLGEPNSTPSNQIVSSADTNSTVPPPPPQLAAVISQPVPLLTTRTTDISQEVCN